MGQVIGMWVIEHCTHSKHNDIWIGAEKFAGGSDLQPDLLLCCRELSSLVNWNRVFWGLCDNLDDGKHPSWKQVLWGWRLFSDLFGTSDTQLSRCNWSHWEQQDQVRVRRCSAASSFTFTIMSIIWGMALSLKCVTQLMSFDGVEGLFFPHGSAITVNEI